MDTLDLAYRERIGPEISDALIAEHVKLDLLFTDKVCGHMAYGHIGGADWGPLRGRTIVGSGKTQAEAAKALLDNPPHMRPKSLRSAAWALSQALELLANATRGGPEHQWHKCKQPCETPHCVYCEGGLARCDVCGQAEVELERFCPGARNGS